MRVPWTERRSTQSTLKEICLGCSLEGLMLKLKLQYFGRLMRRVDSSERTLMLGKIDGGEGDDRGWDGWMASPTQWRWVWVNYWSWWWTGRPDVLRFMGSQSRTQLINWTELNTWKKKSKHWKFRILEGKMCNKQWKAISSAKKQENITVKEEYNST